jgi:hypothetical protein
LAESRNFTQSRQPRAGNAAIKCRKFAKFLTELSLPYYTNQGVEAGSTNRLFYASIDNIRFVPDPDARDIELYETILSGDLNGDDKPNFTDNGDIEKIVQYDASVSCRN